ncbi:MAG: hypothetical protein RMI53_05560 [Nitrososphaerota archaeon]|nr:hypothetical protein [Nitrososphaerota archaeon]
MSKMKLWGFAFIIIPLILPISNASIDVWIMPIECNEDGTYYPGDSFFINYTLSLPSGGTYYDEFGNPCNYYYSFNYVEVWSEYIIGGKATSINGAIPCHILKNTSSGLIPIYIKAHGNYHYQYWINETYYEKINNETIEKWGWFCYWTSSSINWSKEINIEVVDYNPHFTKFLYLIPAETTYRSRIVLLLRYDGNGPSYSLKQRAIMDCYNSEVMGIRVWRGNDVKMAIELGFYDLRSLKEFEEEINWPPEWLLKILNLKEFYMGKKLFMEYGPATEDLPLVFSSNNRYAKIVFKPIDYRMVEEQSELLNINISLYWSRFPDKFLIKETSIYSASLILPIEVERGRMIISTITDGDILFSALLQDPPEGDEWFLEQFINDIGKIEPIPAGTILAMGEGKIMVPRTVTCKYNLSIELHDRKTWIPIYLSSAFANIPAQSIKIEIPRELKVNATYWDLTPYLRINLNSSSPLRKVIIFSLGFIWNSFELPDVTSYELWISKPKHLRESTIVFAEIFDIWGNTKIIELGQAGPYIEGSHAPSYEGILNIMAIMVGIMIGYEIIRKMMDKFF